MGDGATRGAADEPSQRREKERRPRWARARPGSKRLTRPLAAQQTVPRRSPRGGSAMEGRRNTAARTDAGDRFRTRVLKQGRQAAGLGRASQPAGQGRERVNLEFG